MNFSNKFGFILETFFSYNINSEKLSSIGSKRIIYIFGSKLAIYLPTLSALAWLPWVMRKVVLSKVGHLAHVH